MHHFVEWIWVGLYICDGHEIVFCGGLVVHDLGLRRWVKPHDLALVNLGRGDEAFAVNRLVFCLCSLRW
eukprot:scaffold88724_cov75-Phaeocystis_antarctica.AAC.2